MYYYPLIDGVGNFLKRPVVKIADSNLIIEKGVREFLDTYKDTVYADSLTAKLGIYCGTIEKLEETVYPQVSRIVAEYGLGTDVILKFTKEINSIRCRLIVRCSLISWINLFLKFVLFCLCRLVKKVGTVEVLQVLFFLNKETAQPRWYYRHLVDACVR